MLHKGPLLSGKCLCCLLCIEHFVWSVNFWGGMQWDICVLSGFHIQCSTWLLFHSRENEDRAMEDRNHAFVGSLEFVGVGNGHQAWTPPRDFLHCSDSSAGDILEQCFQNPTKSRSESCHRLLQNTWVQRTYCSRADSEFDLFFRRWQHICKRARWV